VNLVVEVPLSLHRVRNVVFAALLVRFGTAQQEVVGFIGTKFVPGRHRLMRMRNKNKI
jgi:hypothetical protein